jgi:hypothetical protein
MEAELQRFEEAVLRELATRSLGKDELMLAVTTGLGEYYSAGMAVMRLVSEGRVEFDSQIGKYRLTLLEHARRIGNDPRGFGC